MRTLTASIAVLLVGAASALAAQPKLPAQFDGGGNGAPVMFKLNKHGKVTKAAAAYSCKGANGIGFAESKKRPKGRVKSDGTLVIRYRYKDSDQTGKLRVRFDVTFPTPTTAKGRVTIKNKSCGAKTINFTADAR